MSAKPKSSKSQTSSKSRTKSKSSDSSCQDLISIIVPCYNVEKYVKKCIDSIKKQSYTNFEVILVDDGSTDHTASIIRQNIKSDKRFKYYHKKNGGLASARNFGLKKAKGKYISFIDSDDYVEKDYLKLLHSSIVDENADLAVCYYATVFNDHSNTIVVDNTIPSLLIHTSSCNKLFDANLFRKNSITYPEGRWYEDTPVITKFIMQNPKISLVKQPLYNYVQRDSSITHTYDDRIFQIYEILQDIEDYAKSQNLYQDYREAIEYLYIFHVLVTTIYRSSFRPDFSVAKIKNILDYVTLKYPNWPDNPYIKTLSLQYRACLYLLKKRRLSLLYLLLKNYAKLQSRTKN